MKVKPDKEVGGSREIHDDDAKTKETNSSSSGYLAILKDFGSNTTAHGFSHLVRTDSIPLKIVWLLAILAAHGYMIYLMVELYVKFYGYPVRESTSTENKAIQFPDVTVCNLEGVSTIGFELMSSDPQTSVFKYDDFTTKALDEIKKSQDLFVFPLSRLDSTYAFYENFDRDELINISHAREDLIIGCRYDNKDCNKDDILKLYVDPFFLNCYTFNARRLGTGNSGSGPSSGLSITAFLELGNRTMQESQPAKYNRFSPITNSAGVRVMIHAPGTMPDPVQNGMDAAAGFSTSFAVTIQEKRSLPHPYGNCTTEKQLKDLESYAYSQSACSAICMQKHIEKECGCVEANYPKPESLSEANTHFCGQLNYSDPFETVDLLACSDNATRNYYSDQDVRDECASLCREPCVELKYSATTSASSWPAVKYHMDFYRQVIATSPASKAKFLLDSDFQAGFPDKSTVTDNFARIIVYLQSQEVIATEQIAAFDFNDMMSDLGGNMGLWAGMSFLTLAEILHLLHDLCLAYRPK